MSGQGDECKRDDDATQPSFIDSSPLGEDLLEGRSQERIAESISQLIRTDRTENRLIGLDGAWGSGKSNLVKIIESKLKDTHHVFWYDAWGHQEDVQRRAFLEELTEDLCENQIIDSSKWKAKLKDLLSRKRETQTKTTPQLSCGVIVTLLVAIVTPIAGTIAGSVESQYLKVLITSAPLLIGFLLWIGASIKAGRILTPNEVYYLYREKDLTNETYVTISEKEPSVREFQKWMKDLSGSLGEKKLIVVFDNMDRLHPDRIRELWASIHTFFADESFDGIWVIIPFDRKHIACAFTQQEGVADQFLSKSFSVIYRVAPPVLTDWQKFFEVKYKEAFGEREDEEFHLIRRTFDLLQDEITPRSIIAFINEMVSLRLSVEADILLRYIAVFVLAKKQILTAPVDQILSLAFLQKAASAFRDDKDLRNHIAALVYHVPLASASQVSLTREIQNALRDKNDSRLNQLAEHLHFFDILEQVVAGEELDIESSVATFALLDPKHVETDEGKRRVGRIWDSLSEKQLRAPVSQQQFTSTHGLLLTNCSSAMRSKIAEHFVKSVRNAKEFSGAEYFRALSALREYVETNELSVDVLSLVTEIRKSPEVFVDYVGAAGAEYGTFKLKCDESELCEFVAARVPDGLEGLAVLSAVRDDKDYDFQPLLARLEEEVAKDALTAENIEPFYRFYKAIATKKPIKSIGPGCINALLSQVSDDSEGQYDLLAMRVAMASRFPPGAGIAATMLKWTDEKQAQRLAERIEYYATYGSLLLSFVSWPQPMLKTILRDMTLNTYGASAMNIADVLPHFKQLHTSLEIAPEDFIDRLDGWAKHAKNDISAGNVADVVKDGEFFECAVRIECDLTSHIIKVMVEHLNSLGVEQWREPLRDVDSYLFTVMYLLLRGEKLKAVPDNAVPAYRDILVDVAKGDFTMEEDHGWDVFYEKTHKNKLKATAKDIRDMFISDGTIDPARFMTLAHMLRYHAALEEKSPDVVRRILAPIATDSGCLEFIVNSDNLAFFASIVNQAGDDASNFKDIIRQRVLLPECSNALIEFAKAIGIGDADAAKAGEEAQEEGPGED
ncbi:KAP family P-loop NTPase fold protein [Anaerobaca lacustris]|uniref:P-loop NTPase fold protein n=1 Tax=Anaerobaca lacustris TaxID=3044600 RepID=A0AAW6U1N0_9BACT|nr:P-loop NTPase fold protein [Sedimentisphaerales bacterium M17dextr]